MILWYVYYELFPNMIALTASLLLTPLESVEQPVVLIEDGIIAEIGSLASLTVPRGARIVDCGDAILSPGLIDIHIHGGAGRDVMEPHADTLPVLESFLVNHGVTAYLPTTVTAPLDVTLTALDRLAKAIEDCGNGRSGRARPIGIHLEGPFLSHTRRGVHPPEHLLPPRIATFNRIFEAARGHITLMTVAPELEGALELIAEAVKRGVRVSLGHSDAGIDGARAGVAAGARHATHTFNAMRPSSHRHPSILDLVLSEDRMTADIIADGIHVDPALIKWFVRAKGVERAVLITDALAATGMPEGHYRLGQLDVEVKEGRCVSGQVLAGSILTMDRALRNVMNFAELDFQQALRTATLNPAEAAGIPGARGTLARGAPADIVVFNRQHGIVNTIVGGTGI